MYPASKERAYNRGVRVWAIQLPHPEHPNLRWNRYTLTSGLSCADWVKTAKEANAIISEHLASVAKIKRIRERIATVWP